MTEPTSATTTGRAPIGAIHHVALTVRDRDASLRWYTEVLGFEVLFLEEGEERRACVLRFAEGGFSVGLVQHSGTDADEPFDPSRLGLDHLAFTVASLEALEAWADHLSAHGVEHSGVIAIPPGAILNLKDPDGIGLALFWDRP